MACAPGASDARPAPAAPGGGAALEKLALVAPAAGAVASEARTPALAEELALTALPAVELRSYIFRGRVLDELRRPFAGAEVRVVGWETPGFAVTSGEGGSYELHADLPQDAQDVHLLASHGSRAGRRRVFVRASAESGPAIEVQPLVLLPTHELEVLVLENAQPAPGARVTVSLGHAFAGLSFEVRSGTDGRARVAHLPIGHVELTARAPGREGRTLAHVPDQADAEVELLPPREVELEIVDAQSGEAIGGASVMVTEMRQALSQSRGDGAIGDGPVVAMEARMMLPSPPLAADAMGRVRLPDIFRTGRYSVQATAPGYPPLQSAGGKDLDTTPEGTPVVIALIRSDVRAVRWPVVAGEGEAPPDGTPIGLAWAPGMRGPGGEQGSPPPGWMEGQELVAPELVGATQLIAVAPDGSLAWLRIAQGASHGPEVSFRRPRRLEVLVKDAHGLPVAGVTASPRNQGNNELAPAATTDAEGRATITGLYGGVVSVQVTPPAPSRPHAAGSVDLELGDGRLEVSLPARGRATLAVSIDGAARLPSHYRLGGQELFAHVLEEHPEQGELTLEVEGATPGAAVRIWLQASGYLSAVTEVEFPQDGSPGRGSIELQRAADLVVEVVRSGTEPVEIFPEQLDPETGAWQRGRNLRSFQGLRYANGPGGTFVFPGTGPGRWRVVEKVSGVTTAEAELLPGQTELRLRLDLASIQWVSGRVEVPDPEELALVRVLVEGLEAPGIEWMPAREPPKGLAVREGTFRLMIPGDRPVRIVPWHPWLMPAPGSVPELTQGREDLVLRLVAGRELRVTMPRAAPGAAATSLRVARLELGGQEPLQWHHAPVANGNARTGVPPGRWDFWLDAGAPFAPLRLHDVATSEPLVELAPEFQRGSSLRLGLLGVPEGQATPRMFMSASPLEDLPYLRQGNSRGEQEVVLEGLGAGRFEVRASSNDQMGRQEKWTLELDGASERVLEFRVR